MNVMNGDDTRTGTTSVRRGYYYSCSDTADDICVVIAKKYM